MKIFLVGMPGSGKTKIGRALGRTLGLAFYDLDEEIVQREGRSINDLFRDEGEPYFRELERRCLHRAALREEAFVLATGGGAPCFFDNMDYMNRKGITVFLDVPVREIASRMVRKGTHKRPLLKDVSKERLLQALEDKYSQREPYYSMASLRISEGLDAFEERVRQIAGKIRDLEG